MNKFLFLILTLAVLQSALLQAYQPKLLWTKYIGSQPGAAVISNDDRFIYCTEGTVLYKFEIDSGTILKQWDIGGRSTIIRISNDDKILYIGCYQGLKIFDLIQEKIIKKFEAVQVSSLDISPDNSKLIYYSMTGTLNDSARVLSLPDFNPIQSFRYNAFGTQNNVFAAIWYAHFLPDGQRIVWTPTYFADQPTSNLDIYDITQNQIVSSIKEAHTAYINDIAVSSDGNFIASSGSEKDRFLKVWDIKTKQSIFKKYIDHEIQKVIFTKDNKYVISGGNYANYTYVLDYFTSRIVTSIDEPGKGGAGIIISKGNNKVGLISDEVHLFSINFDSLVSVNEQIIPDPNTIYPNPVTNTVNITINVPTSNNYLITINNINGRIIKTLLNDYLYWGNNIKIFNVSDLSIGTYFINISSINYSKTYKLIKER